MRDKKRFAGLKEQDAVLFTLSLALLMVGALVKGPFISVDTWKFLDAGKEIIQWVCSSETGFAGLTKVRLFPTYAISSVLLTSIYVGLSLEEWGVIGFNCILFAWTVVLVFRMWWSMCPEPQKGTSVAGTLTGITGGLYIVFGLPDGFLWSYAVLTDILFLFWVVAFSTLVVSGLLTGAKSAWVLALLLAVTGPFVRPPGILLPVLFMFSVALYWIPVRVASDWKSILVYILVPAVAVFAVSPWLVMEYLNGGVDVQAIIPDFIEPQFRQAVVFFKEGIIIANRLELAESPVMSYSHIWETMAYRLLYYFVPLRFGEYPYSTIHNVVNGIYMLTTLPLFMYGLKSLAEQTGRIVLAGIVVGMVGYCFALLHSITLVSFDWRYQVPAMLTYWLFSGVGFYSILYRTGVAEYFQRLGVRVQTDAVVGKSNE